MRATLRKYAGNYSREFINDEIHESDEKHETLNFVNFAPFVYSWLYVFFVFLDVLRQPLVLIEKDHRLVRRDLEALAA